MRGAHSFRAAHAGRQPPASWNRDSVQVPLDGPAIECVKPRRGRAPEVCSCGAIDPARPRQARDLRPRNETACRDSL